MPPPKNKSLKKSVHEIEDELNVDSDVEDIVDKILDIFDIDVDSQDEDSGNDSSDDDDFGGGDSGGGGSSSDW